jgi:hypothetical protein
MAPARWHLHALPISSRTLRSFWCSQTALSDFCERVLPARPNHFGEFKKTGDFGASKVLEEAVEPEFCLICPGEKGPQTVDEQLNEAFRRIDAFEIAVQHFKARMWLGCHFGHNGRLADASFGGKANGVFLSIFRICAMSWSLPITFLGSICVAMELRRSKSFFRTTR